MLKPILTLVEEKLKLTKECAGGYGNPTHFKSLVWSLRYLTSTRPDINFAVDLISRFIENSCQPRLQVGKRILMYIEGIQNDDIFYSENDPVELFDYIDSYWIGDTIEKKSTLEWYAFFYWFWDIFPVKLFSYIDSY